MIIKRYIVNTMNEAMTRIRYELGTDAVIISQRKIRKPGIKGFFSSKSIEVTVAVENEVLNEKKQNVANKNFVNSDDRNNNNQSNNSNGNNNELNKIELNSIEAIRKVLRQENVNMVDSRVVQKQDSGINNISSQNEEQNAINSHNLMSEMMNMKSMISKLSVASEGKAIENKKRDRKSVV